MKPTLKKISIQPGIDPDNPAIRLEFSNDRFHQVEIAGPYVEHIETALIQLLHGLRDDHFLRESKNKHGVPD